MGDCYPSSRDRFAASSLGHFDHQDRTVSVQDHILGVTTEQQRADRGAMAQPNDDEVCTAALRSAHDRVIRVQYGGRLKVEFKASVDNMLTDGLDLGRERSLFDQHSVRGEVYHHERVVPQDRFLTRSLDRRPPSGVAR